MADNKKLILNLFAGMQDALFLGDRFANGEFVSFLQPGQFISTTFKETPASNDMAIQADIANLLIDSSYVNKYKDIEYSGSTELLGSVNQVYEDILTKMALPQDPLSQEDYAELQALESWLDGNVDEYESRRDEYFDAVEAYDFEAAKQTPSPAKLQRLAQKKAFALNQWKTKGKLQLYENKQGRYIYLTAQDPNGYWATLQARMTAQSQQSPSKGPYFSTYLVPQAASWATAGWGEFDREISEQDSFEYSKATSWSGGISGSWGLWSWGGGASGSSQFQHNESQVSSVKLKFEYLRVRIFRPWLVEDVFGYNFWTWNKNLFAGQMVSDGGNLTVTPPVRPIGRMPVLPRYLILVRNLELSAKFGENESTFAKQQLQSSASVGWGPFSVSGSYSESTESKQVSASFDGVTFKVAQPQIIARTGIMLPRSPQPRKDLKWDDTAWFPDNDVLLLQKTADKRAGDYLSLWEAGLLLEAHDDAQVVAQEWYENKKVEIEEKVKAAQQATA